jgi:Zn-dependent protease with chaperone function
MTKVKAYFYDGKSSQQRKVSICAEPPDRLRVVGEDIDLSYALADVRLSSRVGNTRRRLYFADGAQCESEDNDAIDQLFAKTHSATHLPALAQLLHRWESRIAYVLFAVALTAVLLWAGVTYGIPALAKQIAFKLPAATDQMLGRQALEGLDQTLLTPTQLPPKRQAELHALFTAMAASIPGASDYRLALRASKMIGANALALPSGIVVVTDPLVALAKNDDELTAVLAHEIGHLRQRHSLRQVLQNSATALIVIAATGDIGSLTSLGAVLPTLLVQSKYSRDFEREADDFAVDYLKEHAIPSESFSAILRRMEGQAGTSGNLSNYLSSHPATQERAERSSASR